MHHRHMEDMEGEVDEMNPMYTDASTVGLECKAERASVQFHQDLLIIHLILVLGTAVQLLSAPQETDSEQNPPRPHSGV